MTETRICLVAGRRVLALASQGPALATPDHALDVIGTALGERAEVVTVPVARLAPGFLDLSTRMAGEFLHKLGNYRLHLVVVGDISRSLGDSKALRDFVREANRGRQVWFVADEEELARRLASAD